MRQYILLVGTHAIYWKTRYAGTQSPTDENLFPVNHRFVRSKLPTLLWFPKKKIIFNGGFSTHATVTNSIHLFFWVSRDSFNDSSNEFTFYFHIWITMNSVYIVTILYRGSLLYLNYQECMESAYINGGLCHGFL